MSDKDNIVFHEDGRASEPCCWCCKDFTICLDGEQYCVRLEQSVDRDDLCNRWIPRDPSSMTDDLAPELSDDTPEPTGVPSPEEPSSINIYSILGTIIIGLIIFILVRNTENWAGALDNHLGIAYGIWLILFIILGLAAAIFTIFVMAAISAKFDPIDPGATLEYGGGRVSPSLTDTLHSNRTLCMSEMLEGTDGKTSLASRNRALFNRSDTWEAIALLALLYERVSALLLEATSREGSDDAAARALSLAANLIDGVPEHEDNVTQWRTAPENLDWCDWNTVATTVATRWAESARDFFGTADSKRTGQDDPYIYESPETKEFAGKSRKCVQCDVVVQEGQLQCPSCGNEHLIWE